MILEGAGQRPHVVVVVDAAREQSVGEMRTLIGLWFGQAARKQIDEIRLTTYGVAGEALASVRRSTAIDAIVMASAAQRGDIVYTSDVDDLQKLAAQFRAVRVLGIG
jgi:UDP-N-acetylmuramyl tripeptide synthase